MVRAHFTHIDRFHLGDAVVAELALGLCDSLLGLPDARCQHAGPLSPRLLQRDGLLGPLHEPVVATGVSDAEQPQPSTHRLDSRVMWPLMAFIASVASVAFRVSYGGQ